MLLFQEKVYSISFLEIKYKNNLGGIEVKKRLLVLIMIAVMILSIFSGCGGTKEQPSSDSNPPQSEGQNNDTSEEVDSGNTQEENGIVFSMDSYPLVKDGTDVTFKIVAQTSTLAPEFSEMELIQRYEDETGIHIEWECIPDNVYQEKKNIILQSDDLPDAFWNTGFSDADTIQYGKMGILFDYGEYVEEYMPYLQSIFEKRPNLKAVCTMPDGGMYTFPGGSEMGFVDENGDYFGIGTVPFFYSINKAWIDKLGLEVPATLDELEEVLTAFKTQDPNGNGKNDEIPMSFIHMWWCADIGGLFGGFGLGDTHNHRVVRDGKVEFTFLTEEYKEAIQYFHNWVKKGLIDIESFTQDDKAYLAKGQHPDYILGSYIWWETPEVVGNERASDYILLPPLPGPSGKNVVTRSEDGAGGRGAFAITTACENPKLMMRWLDYMYEPYNSAQNEWGPIGVVYDLVDGKMIQKEAPEGTTYGEWKALTAPQGPKFTLAEHFGTIIDMEPRAVERIETIKEVFYPHMETTEVIMGPLSFTEEEINRINSIEPDITSPDTASGYVEQMRAKWLKDGGIEDEWDDYLKQLEAMGVQELLSIYQEAYDRSIQAGQ